MKNISKILDDISGSKECGCYFCKTTFEKSEIKDYIHNSPVCPNCGIDAVIGEKALGETITIEKLREINKIMF